MRNVLVYGWPGKGHERRYVDVLARVVDGTPLVARLSDALLRLAAWRGPLLCSTADAYVGPFLFLCLVRSMLGMRTMAVLIREPSERWGWRRYGLQATLYNAITALPTVRVFSILKPPPGEDVQSWIYDVEWWDLHVAPLSAEPSAFLAPAAEPRILFLGDLHPRKGAEFFLAAASRAAERRLALRFVFAGNGLDAQTRQRFASAGGVLLPRIENDREFVSCMRAADWIWCCYRPDWNRSSGLFGRVLQLGKRCVVRKGSYLEPFQALYQRGFAVEFGDTDGLLDGLLSPQAEPLPAPIADFAAVSVARLLDALPKAGTES